VLMLPTLSVLTCSLESAKPRAAWTELRTRVATVPADPEAPGQMAQLGPDRVRQASTRPGPGLVPL